jgi:hypothetical protein
MIAIYVEKEFLDFFWKSGQNLKYKEDIVKLLINYSEKELYHNYNNEIDFINPGYNPLGAQISSGGGTNIISNNNFLNSKLSTKIAFTGINFKPSNINVNFIHFTIENIDKKWGELVNKLKWRVALDDKNERAKIMGFWNGLKDVKVKNVVLIDKYLIKNDINQLFFKTYINPLNFNDLMILSNELIVEKNIPKEENRKIIRLEEKILNNIFNAFHNKIRELKFYKFYYYKIEKTLNFHDRLLISNFYLVEVGVGFDNLISNNEVNSVLSCDSILDEFTYNRIRRLKKRIEEYLIVLKQKPNFKNYPIVVKRTI